MDHRGCRQPLELKIQKFDWQAHTRAQRHTATHVSTPRPDARRSRIHGYLLSFISLTLCFLISGPVAIKSQDTATHLSDFNYFNEIKKIEAKKCFFAQSKISANKDYLSILTELSKSLL